MAGPDDDGFNRAEVTSMRRPWTRLTSSLLMVLAVVFSAGAGRGDEGESYFPEGVFTPKNKEFNATIVDATAVHLRAMKEPSLWKLSQKDRAATVYRFLWLASNQHPICIRLTQSGDIFVLHVARHDGPPGLTAGQQTLDRDVKLSAERGTRLIAQLASTTFWKSPVEVWENRGIADGDRVVIEGVKDGRYHVMSRAGLATGESVKMFCRSLVELADVPDVLKVWDGFRGRERKSSRYRPEPTQTEYQGGPELEPPGATSPDRGS